MKKTRTEETEPERDTGSSKTDPWGVPAHSPRPGLPTPRSSGVSHAEKASVHDKNDCRLLIKKNRSEEAHTPLRHVEEHGSRGQRAGLSDKELLSGGAAA